MAAVAKGPGMIVSRGRRLGLGRTRLMGVVNLTPDSFSDGGLAWGPQRAFRRAAALVAAGADWLDLGAESTRPGAPEVSAAQERRRLLPALRRIRRLPVPISIDTRKPEVAAAALEAGADLLNDVTGLRNPDMRRLAARARVAVVLMHMRGEPGTMQRNPRYRRAAAEVKAWLLAAARRAERDGVRRSRIILDPGIGFGKTARHNWEILRDLPELVAAGYPVLVGPSRKSFLTSVLGPKPPRERIWGTAAVAAWAVAAGVRILRVHDVAEMIQVVRTAEAVRAGGSR